MTGFDHRYIRFLVRGRTAAENAALNEVPFERELVFDVDTLRSKLGDGVTPWVELPYLPSGGVSGPGTSTDKALVRFDGTAGSSVQDSQVLLSDAGELSGYKGNVNRQTGTSYTLEPEDSGKIVELANAGAITLTAPPDLPAGFVCTIVQALGGVVTVASSGDGTVVNRQNQFKTAGPNAMCAFYVRSNVDGDNAVGVIGGDTSA